MMKTLTNIHSLSKMNTQFFIMLALFTYSHGCCKSDERANSKLKLVYSSKVPIYTDNPAIPAADHEKQLYIPSNIAVIDADYWKDKTTRKEKIFVTTPRQKPGTPASLSTIVTSGNEQLLAPYPSWNEHNIHGGCDNIISAFRTQVDECGRLWVIDTGVVESATGNARKLCQPKILIYDLKTDTLISKHEVPSDLLVEGVSLLITIVVDTRDSECKDAFAYIADTTSYQIIVFDGTQNKFWNFRNKYMYPFPQDGTYEINGVSFDFMDGILGMAIGPMSNGDRTLFFHSLASRRESWVQTSILRNQKYGGGDLDSAKEHFYLSSGTRTSQSAAEAMSKHGALIFGLLGENTLACWPKYSMYRTPNIKKLEKDNVNLQFLSGVKIVDDVLVLVSSRLQNFFVDKVNPDEVNYRVLIGSVDYVTRGTKCHRS